MIAADTSAIVAVAFGEPEREIFVQTFPRLAKVHGLPLLYKGRDSETDIASALTP